MAGINLDEWVSVRFKAVSPMTLKRGELASSARASTKAMLPVRVEVSTARMSISLFRPDDPGNVVVKDHEHDEDDDENAHLLCSFPKFQADRPAHRRFE
jgi:hypothetical protein